MNASQIPLFVLAGGRATRLTHLSQDCPKYLMPISKNKVFADAHLTWASEMGFEKVILSIGYLGQMIQDYCLDGQKWGLKISYLDDGPSLLGTGGAVKKSLQFEYSELAVTYGDTILDINMSDLLDYYEKSRCLAAMTIFKNDIKGHTCNVDFDQKYITYNKINPLPDWKFIDYGFMILKRQFIEDFPNTVPFDLNEPLSTASYKKQVVGYMVQNRFWEIGSPQALSDFQQRFEEN